MSSSSWPPGSDLELHQALSFNDDYDDVTGLVDLPSSNIDKAVRRRSSKACDQCRKSKCKCERSAPGEPCRSCVALGTECTFNGPSRKRGPPNEYFPLGYIDAIEARLHQTEALLGIMLSTNDARAQTLLRDLAQDSLAKEIIDRVDNSPYGVKGRRKLPRGTAKQKARHPAQSLPIKQEDKTQPELGATHPSNEWQDQVIAILDAASVSQTSTTSVVIQQRSRESLPSLVTALPSFHSRSSISQERTTSDGETYSPDTSSGRRQRRRLNGHDVGSSLISSPHHSSAPNSAIPPSREPHLAGSAYSQGSSTHHEYFMPLRHSSPSLTSESEDDFAEAIGQLSLNEDEEVRYHGKASGLHLLGVQDRSDRRSEGGIWRFPKARVWPPLPSGSVVGIHDEEGFSRLPSLTIQNHLLELYFVYVHPSLPIVHKQAFWDSFAASSKIPGSTQTQESNPAASLNRHRRRVPPLLLFAMFSIAARYSDHPSTPQPPDDPSLMWVAGDQYLDEAKTILDRSYASSKPSTCQALLLMGYREIGIGAMAQAWIYIGMAIRMAQDLGMHRQADGWARVGFGGRLFGERELNERRRIWYACVVMDKYVSSYIGRPLSIFEQDFDTLLPSQDDPEESDGWRPHCPSSDGPVPASTVQGRIISCFNASACLSTVLGKIIQGIYAVRPASSRHGEAAHLEGVLDKWYIDLPEHLRHEPAARQNAPLPHVLVLHMQYWCAVLLLHRPFIRAGKQSSDSEDSEGRSAADRHYELSEAAANHITSIAVLYSERYPLKRCTVFLCYFVFSASVMHVISLSSYPNHPQARLGLTKCMEVLGGMETVWPSAGRALELLRGSSVNKSGPSFPLQTAQTVRTKRSVDHLFEDATLPPMHPSEYSSLSRQHPYTVPSPSPQLLYPASDLSAPHEQSQSGLGPSYGSPTGHTIYSGPLSTSILPQVYSTGLFEDRGGIRSPTTMLDPNRYPPQYWSDYSTYSQLGGYDLSGHGHHAATPLSAHAFLPQQEQQTFISRQI